ncbi:MAG: PRC-barrel domain-containing protein [Patescibacteria group bacterium]
MRLSKKQILGLRVVTKRGFFLGRVCDITLDTESHLVTHYRVRPPWRILCVLIPPTLSGQTYLIAREQVVGMTDREMTVRDGAILELSEPEQRYYQALSRAKDVAVQPEPTMRGDAA